MTTLARDTTLSLKTAVRISESLCGLPAVATQDWCEKAAAALLPIVGSGTCMILIAQIDDRGVIQQHEANGIAACATAEITTTVGRGSTGTTTVMVDPADESLARVRTNLAQARELSWAPGPMIGGTPRVGAAGGIAGNTQALLRRWDAVPHTSLLLAAAHLGIGGRTIVVELAPAPGAPVSAMHELEIAMLESVLPLLVRRAVIAIGGGPIESAHWLTTREQAILRHLLMGKSVREIAVEIERSPHTVHDHVKNLHRKLNANSRGELIARALGYMEVKPIEHRAAAGSREEEAGG